MRKIFVNKNAAAAVVMSGALVMTTLAGCGQTGTTGSASDTSSNGAYITTAVSENQKKIELTDSKVDINFTDRDKSGEYDENSAVKITLNGNSAGVSGSGVSISGSTVTITAAGTYIISGSLSDGQIVVAASDSDKVQLVLNNAEINCSTSAAIYVKSADKVFVTLPAGTTSSLGGGTEYIQTDDNTVDGVIFSKSDLTLNGTGTLKIDADYKHGIVTKDTLCITGGTYVIDAVKTCLAGKDGIKILDGSFTLTAGNKGLNSGNDDDAKEGNIYIAGGAFTIKSEDDSIHADGSCIIAGGTYTIDAGDDGIHADYDTIITDGNITITDSYEGIEGRRVTVSGGTINLTASDDGINAATGGSSDEQQMPGGQKGDFGGFGRQKGAGGQSQDGQQPQEMQMPQDGQQPSGMDMGNKGQAPGSQSASDDDVYIKITGGTITVNASGDGIDSNGNLYITGGTVYVAGPTSNGDGALDYDGEASITGGTLIAAGSSGMAQGMGSNSTQCSILVNLSETIAAGSVISLKDSSGNVLISWTSPKQFSSVVISTAELVQGSTYTLVTGDTQTEVTLSSVATTSGNAGFGGGFGGAGGRGGNGGGRR
ncbi:MAG: carbohydrate-binding domain-containing protein [[Bacteroides] pectinophilus]|nr:carbohydrate-binding domain-containing protein [[Bacteroides] pectinophilus]